MPIPDNVASHSQPVFAENYNLEGGSRLLAAVITAHVTPF